MTIDEAEKIRKVVENKGYIVQLVNTIAKTLIEAFDTLKIEDVNMFQLGYNKAIDDFVEKLIRYVDCGHLCSPTDVRWADLSVVEMVKKLEEQLKEGGNIELSEHSKSQGNRTGKQKATIEAEPKTKRQKQDIFSTPRR